MSGTSLRQVAIVQCSDASGAIQWQRFFHGESPNQTAGNGFSTNARAISVFPAPNRTDTRVAICGDTFDSFLPSSPDPHNPNYSNLWASGFVAIYDGTGVLLWSHMFVGGNSLGDCAITDVSIRVEGAAPSQQDVLTYCGATAYGGPGSAIPTVYNSIIPHHAFQAPPANCGGDNPADGAAENGAPEWDGIVGRLVIDHSTHVTGTGGFLSFVGGQQEDALFGIAEIDADKFVVVGCTDQTSRVPLLSPFTFPVTAGCVTSTVDPRMGVVMVFDASSVRAGTGNLQLTASRLIGPVSNPANDQPGMTWARDVVVQDGRIIVVGSTTDPALPTLLAFAPALNGPADGFVAVTTEFALNFFTDGFLSLSYFGGMGIDGLTGVAAWSEYADHFAVVGFTGPEASRDVIVADVWINTDSSTTNPFPLNMLRLLREYAIVGNGREEPAALGLTAGMGGSPTFAGGPDPVFGRPRGNGIAVDSKFRVTVVGSTDAGLQQVGGGAFVFPYSDRIDGFRVVMDLLPYGVSRTDGTGITAGMPVPAGVGTTTPVCALSPFGRQISPTPSNAPLDRILIDFQGTNLPLSTDVALIMDRPPPSYQLEGTFLQFGFISNPPVVQSQVELWTLSSPVLFVHTPPQASSASIWFKIASLPSAPGRLTAQFVCLVTSQLACTNDFVVASPALTFSW